MAIAEEADARRGRGGGYSRNYGSTKARRIRSGASYAYAGGGGGASYYANCSAARAAGAAPVRSGQPGYSRKLDRDGDGVGCE
nr:excalibur calcium-binding domain-containing protein [Sphingomonas sp. UBA978]